GVPDLEGHGPGRHPHPGVVGTRARTAGRPWQGGPGGPCPAGECRSPAQHVGARTDQEGDSPRVLGPAQPGTAPGAPALGSAGPARQGGPMTVVRRPAGVAVVTDGALDSEALAYAAPLPDGPITVLRGVTAVVYRVLLGGPADPRAAV